MLQGIGKVTNLGRARLKTRVNDEVVFSLLAVAIFIPHAAALVSGYAS